MRINEYWKSVVAFIGALTGGLAMYLDDNVITTDEYVPMVTVVITLIGVYFIPNQNSALAKKDEPKAHPYH